MAVEEIVTSPALVAVLRAAETTRLQCEGILNLLALHNSSPEDDFPTAELESQKKRLKSQLAIVRGLNRKSILDVRRTKQDTADARQEVDKLHLQLQNLYYEQRHLRGEITLCEGYDHPFQRLPLLPVDDYLALHPEHAGLDEHELMRERIDHEHAERLQLEEARQSLLKRKQALIAENNKRKELLAALDKKIEDWVDGAEAVEKGLDESGEEMGKIGAIEKTMGFEVMDGSGSKTPKPVAADDAVTPLPTT